ncbi:hypothetical protein K4H28_13625 [Deefgea tanakiae]|uniref:Uncharacterized protein n=1 Tax=Deefgea tanakiae TaxID=2865840 RepID=A0ABX8Z412_9NEIS|nr:hypothetical protein [Deefgea tanakiae]QZA77311.1 hypothetical protein K4H28_13625 [Deefgea tanakiae]
MNSIKFQPSLLLPSLARPRLDEAQADKKSEPKNIGLDFFKQMQSQKTEMVSSRKQAAQARMAQLKAQIENALRFAHIGSGNPRMVAQLAKELKALVAQYGGSSGSVGNMVMPTVNGEQGNTAQATAATEQGAEQSVDVAQMAEAAQVAAEATTAAASAEDAVAQDQAEEKTKDQLENNATTPNTSRQGDAGDKAFFALAKELAQKLKLLLAIENQKIKTEADQKDAKIAKKEIEAVGEAIEKAEISVANEHAEITTMNASASYDAGGGISSSTESSMSTFA